jgi:hypothetical protein
MRRVSNARLQYRRDNAACCRPSRRCLRRVGHTNLGGGSKAIFRMCATSWTVRSWNGIPPGAGREPDNKVPLPAMSSVPVAQRISDVGIFRLARESVTIVVRDKKRWDSGEKRDFQYRYRLWQRGTEGSPSQYVGEYEMSDAVMREELGVLDAWARAKFRDGVFDVHELAQAVARGGLLLISDQGGDEDEDEDESDTDSNSVYKIAPDHERVVNRVYAARDGRIGLEVVFDMSADEARAEVIGNSRSAARAAPAEKTMDVPVTASEREDE